MATVYATAEQLKAQPGIDGAGDDSTIELFLVAASLAIDGFCNRMQDGFQATVAPEQRSYTGLGLPWTFIDEAVEITQVEVKHGNAHSSEWTVISSSEYVGFQGDPNWPNFNRFPYRGIMLTSNKFFPAGFTDFYWYTDLQQELPAAGQPRKVPNIRVTGRWGYADVVPEPVVSATIAQAARWFKRGQSFWADTAGGDSFGSLSYRQALDPDVKMMLELSRLKRPVYG